MTEPVYVYLIHCLDDLSVGMVDSGERFGGSAKRMAVYAEHKKYQGQTATPDSPNYIRKIAAGPLESDDGKYMIGSTFIVYATKSEAEAFIHNDPFFAAEVWGKISINRYVSIPNGIKLVRAEKDGEDIKTVRMVPEF